MQTISKVRSEINPRLRIEGILMTMPHSWTSFGKEIDSLIWQTYGDKIKVLDQEIPRLV